MDFIAVAIPPHVLPRKGQAVKNHPFSGDPESQLTVD
jgi:hypothetical protein